MSSQDKFAQASYLFIRGEVAVGRFIGMSKLSTSRSFDLYRQIFFDRRPAKDVLESIREEVIVDVGCGYTPYFSDSMFQACEAEGIAFYGVDPVLAKEMRSTWYHRFVARATGSVGRFLPHPPGLSRTLGVYAHEIPLETGSVDRILASMSLFIWIDNGEILAGIFEEFARLLKPGGQIHIYPQPPWRFFRWRNPRLIQALEAFDVTQTFVFTTRPISAPPAYRTILTRRSPA